MELKAEVKISPDLLKIGERFRAAMEAGLLRAAGAVEAEAVKRAPVRTGNLKDSIRKYVELKQGRAVVTATAKYAVFVHEGTGIYGPYKTPIVPVNKKALAFTIGTQKFLRKSVKGQKPNPFMKGALEKVGPDLESIFMAGFNSVLKS